MPAAGLYALRGLEDFALDLRVFVEALLPIGAMCRGRDLYGFDRCGQAVDFDFYRVG